MSKLIYFDFTCEHCGHKFEELIQPAEREAPCPECKELANRDVSLGHLDWKMGVSLDFPTMAEKWSKMQYKKNTTDKGSRSDGAPNLKMY